MNYLWNNLKKDLGNFPRYAATAITSKTIPNMSEDITDKQKTLQSGTCVAFGRIFKIPMIVKMEKADPPPTSANCDIYGNWMVRLKQ